MATGNRRKLLSPPREDIRSAEQNTHSLRGRANKNYGRSFTAAEVETRVQIPTRINPRVGRARDHPSVSPAQSPAAVAVVCAIVSLCRRLQATILRLLHPRTTAARTAHPFIRHDSFIAKLPPFASVAFPITAQAYTSPFPAR